uniref:G_PROTEIN_RECEP_F1_2 domain-containing protein n=1 Tax=Ascaris lumbricoides TaxID=6252 RepID=A0A0M3HUD5_ASCLU
MDNESESEFYEEAPDYFLGRDILLTLRYYARHVIPCFCLTGIVGNCMALMLIRSNYWLKRLTSNIYLCTLSLCSCLFLITVLITWMDGALEVPLYNSSEIGCRLLTFFAHMSDFNCVWMISWVSCDRAIVLFRPGIRRKVCSKKFARYMVMATLACSFVLYSWCLISAGLEQENNSLFCGLSKNLSFIGYDLGEMHFYFTFLDTVICTVVPSLLITVVNSLAVYRYRQCMKIYSSGVLRVRFLKVPDEHSPHLEETTNAKKLLLSQQSHTMTQYSTQSNRSANGGNTFVFLTVPNYGFRVYISIFNPTSVLFQLLFFATFLLYYLHHAVLFYMYIFWSPQMKKQLKPTALRLLECYCCKTVPEFGHSQGYHR